MADKVDPAHRGGFFRRAWRGVCSPSARWSVGALLLGGLLIGAVGVIGTQVMVAATGTNQFCSSACHSMTMGGQRVPAERALPQSLGRAGRLP